MRVLDRDIPRLELVKFYSQFSPNPIEVEDYLRDKDLKVIYGLTDENGQIRYIGQTPRPFGRILKHLANLNGYSRRQVWMKEMAAEGNLPGWVLCELAPRDRKGRESLWIEALQVGGFALTNGTRGERGGGSSGRTGWHHTPEAKKAIGDKNRGRKVPENVAEALRLANTGRKHSPESRALMRESQLKRYAREREERERKDAE